MLPRVAQFADTPPACTCDRAPGQEVFGAYSIGGRTRSFLKVQDGCDNFCAFCAIPFIRGRYRSRTMENILEEARELAAHGAKELIVIAQDITRYGTDLYGKRMLAELCRRLSEIEGVRWLRLHYLYPDQFDDELIEEIASNDKIVKYLDIPIQHINDTILKRMNRRGTGGGRARRSLRSCANFSARPASSAPESSPSPRRRGRPQRRWSMWTLKRHGAAPT